MKPRHQVSRAAIELIKKFEGYRQMSARLPDGRWTLGYGHTMTARQGAEVSEKDAEALLLYDLISVAHAVNEYTFTPLTQNQFDALVCFAFNIGLENFRRSTVCRRINEGSLIQAACAMEMWRKADFEGERIVVDALVRRRAAEKALFLTPPGGRYVAAPTPVLEPRIDYDAGLLIPKQTPIEVTTTLEGDRVVSRREDEPAPVSPLRGPTASERAAADLNARLAAIFPDDPEEEAAIAGRSAAAAKVPDPTPPTAMVQTPEAAAEPGTLDLTLVEPKPIRAATPGETGAFGWMDKPQGKSKKGRKPKKPMVWPIVLLALLGAGVFAASIVWNAKAAPETGGDPTPALLVGWGLGLFGILCFGWAVYLLLRRLGGESADD